MGKGIFCNPTIIDMILIIFEEEYSLHINCGGSKTTVGGIIFEEDQHPGGDSLFVPVIPNWGISTTGRFWDVNATIQPYITNNMSVLELNNSELYTSARLSPLSLTYYARCLGNGNYTVKLHFSEIIIRGNKSFYSLGRRIFDVYIQVVNCTLSCALYLYATEDEFSD